MRENPGNPGEESMFPKITKNVWIQFRNHSKDIPLEISEKNYSAKSKVDFGG